MQGNGPVIWLSRVARSAASLFSTQVRGRQSICRRISARVARSNGSGAERCCVANGLNRLGQCLGSLSAKETHASAKTESICVTEVDAMKPLRRPCQ